MSRFANLEFDGKTQEASESSEPLKDEAHFLTEALAALANGEFDRAHKAYAKALEYDPDSLPAWLGQAWMLIELEEFQQAGQWADRAMERIREEPDLLAAKAVALARCDDPEAAMAFSDLAIERAAGQPYPWIAHGDALLSIDENQADYCFGKGLQCELENWLWPWLISRAYVHYEKFTLAMKHAQSALALDAGHCVVRLQAARCQRALGLGDLSTASYERARAASRRRRSAGGGERDVPLRRRRQTSKLDASTFFQMKSLDLDLLLGSARELSASDLHLVVGSPPTYRINGEIIVADEDAITAGSAEAAARSLLNEEQKQKFSEDWELCISLMHKEAGRVRVTFYRRNGIPEMCFRFCGDRIPTRSELGLPERIDEVATRPNGLFLITGPTGAGKTTTLNYMVNLINRERRCKIVTIEDPIEYVHENRRAILLQQEVLTDTKSFNSALIHAVRQDPDVIVVGEIRDHEAISTALTAAETGHLVLATMHSPNVAHALERIIGVFEGSAQKQVIMQLATGLIGILSQQLLASVDRSGRALAYELLLANNAVRNLIREYHLHQLENIMQMGARDGMDSVAGRAAGAGWCSGRDPP